MREQIEKLRAALDMFCVEGEVVKKARAALDEIEYELTYEGDPLSDREISELVAKVVGSVIKAITP